MQFHVRCLELHKRWGKTVAFFPHRGLGSHTLDLGIMITCIDEIIGIEGSFYDNDGEKDDSLASKECLSVFEEDDDEESFDNKECWRAY